MAKDPPQFPFIIKRNGVVVRRGKKGKPGELIPPKPKVDLVPEDPEYIKRRKREQKRLERKMKKMQAEREAELAKKYGVPKKQPKPKPAEWVKEVSTAKPVEVPKKPKKIKAPKKSAKEKNKDWLRETLGIKPDERKTRPRTPEEIAKEFVVVKGKKAKPGEAIPARPKGGAKELGPPTSLTKSERNMEILVEAAKKEAEPHVDALLEEIRTAVDTPDLVQARTNLEGMVWSERRQYAEVTHVHIKRADAYGHLETAKRRDKIIDSDGFVMLKPKEGLEYFTKRKVISPEQWAEADDKMKRKAFSVARATNEYHVEYVKNMIVSVLEGDMDERDFRKRMANMLGTSHRDYYIETVYRTNMQSAYQHGRYVQQNHPEVLEALPYWQYRTVGDSRVRDSHKAMDGKIYPATHNVWDLWYPPNGYSCRCRVDELSRSEAEAEGISEEMPKELPDEGFANSPKDWLEREF